MFAKRFFLLVAMLGLTLAAQEGLANTKKKAKGKRKPSSAGFKVKDDGKFTRVVDKEQGIVCYFAKQGDGHCAKLPPK